MKKFMAVFLGSVDPKWIEAWNARPDKAEVERKGMEAWNKWGEEHKGAVVDFGSPLGKTKRIDKSGISDVRNELAAFCIVQAESYDEAAKIFIDHPHFTIFPGDRVEVMEMLPIPEMK